MTHKGTVTLETERLTLRTLRETDFDAVHAYMSDERIKRLMYYEPNTPEDTRKLIADSISNDCIFEFGVVRKDTAILIGNIGLYIGGKEANGDDEAEIGWLINHENQGLGFATEAAKAIVKFAFEQLGLRRIIAHCDSENTASWNIMEKLGMRREAHYKKSRKSNSVLGYIWRNAFGYAILAENYFNQKPQSNMNNQTYEKARAFIYRNARPLDLVRWQYHFENGSKEAVLTALAAYQNEDGGFGYALEPDAWNPNSSPIQTWTATEILREIGFTDRSHPIIQGILRYLESEPEFNGHSWGAVVPSHNDYPRAPWWGYDSNSACRTDYNPTACLTGFIIRFAEKDSDLYQLGCRIAKEAYDAYFTQDLLGDMHTAGCYIRLLEYCEEADFAGINLAALRERLREQVKHSITKNTAEWETGYICKPSQFFNTRDSIFYADNKDIADYECDFIIRTQQSDGSWPIPWSWADYPEEWSVSKNWWKGNGAILNLLYLKGMGRL